MLSAKVGAPVHGSTLIFLLNRKASDGCALRVGIFWHERTHPRTLGPESLYFLRKDRSKLGIQNQSYVIRKLTFSRCSVVQRTLPEPEALRDSSSDIPATRCAASVYQHASEGS